MNLWMPDELDGFLESIFATKKTGEVVFLREGGGRQVGGQELDREQMLNTAGIWN